MRQERKPRKRDDNRLRQVMEQAQKLDRRRQAQINNQIATINHLLQGSTYTEEMRVLHEGAAALAVENEDLRTRVVELETTIREHVEAVSDAVSESGSAEG